MNTTYPARYTVMRFALEGLLSDLSILCGDSVGPSDSSTRDVLQTAIVNAQVLADQLTKASRGDSESFLTYPSPSEAMEKIG